MSLERLDTLAPSMHAEAYHIDDQALVQEMRDVTAEQVALDWSHDESSREQYKFHFVSSYLYCFVVAEKVDELKYDRIMEQVCMSMALFSDDSGFE